MHVQIVGLRVGEESLEHIGGLGTFTYFSFDHHVLVVEGTNRQEPRSKHLWNRIDRVEGLLGRSAHIDGMGRAVGSVCRLVLEVDEKKLLAKSSVLQAHAAGVFEAAHAAS